MKSALLVGVINYYPAPQGWRHVHVDIADRPLHDAAKNRFVPPDYVADICELPLDDGSFDRVQAWDVLEHLPHWRAFVALTEVRRVLKPGGELDVQVPNIEAAAFAFARQEIDFTGFHQLLYGQHLGHQQRPGDYHRSGWSAEALSEALAGLGYEPGPDLAAGTMVARYRAVR